MIHTEQFIAEIEKNQCLWDVSVAMYSNQMKKEKAWEAIAKRFAIDFFEKSEEEKKEIVTSLKKKWKNIRGSFRKEWKKTKTRKSRSDTTLHKRYIYYDQLTFLIPVIQSKPKCSNIDDSEEHSSSDSLIALENNPEQRLTHINTLPKKLSSNKRKASIIDSSNDIRDRSFNTVEQSLQAKHPYESFTSNEMFLMSLAGDMNSIPEQNMLRFKVDFLKVFSEIVEKYSPTSSWSSTSTLPFPSPVPVKCELNYPQQLRKRTSTSSNVSTNTTQTI